MGKLIYSMITSLDGYVETPPIGNGVVHLRSAVIGSHP